jgi:hypothetical protein
MDSKAIAKEISRRALDGDINSANEIFQRAIDDAKLGKIESRPTLLTRLAKLLRLNAFG